MTNFIVSLLRRPKRLAVVAVLFIVLLLFLFLRLPIAEWVGNLAQDDLLRSVFNRRKLLLAIALTGVLGLAIWLFVRHRFRNLLVLAAIVIPLLLVVAVHEFQLRFPHAGVANLERYGDAFRVLVGTDAALSRVDPDPTLKLKHRAVPRAAFPVVDVHFHLDSLIPEIDADRLIRALDTAGVDRIVNLDGSPEAFARLAEAFYEKYPDRIIQFVKPDPDALRHEEGNLLNLRNIRKAVQAGARGLKENKSFGLGQRDANGKLVPVDDVRLAPTWDFAGKLGLPLLIHTGEPPSFWEPVDVRNERYLELLQNPGWSLHGKDKPSREELRKQRERLLARHPQTNFIGAHFGMDADDLEYVAYLFDKYPNYYVDISAVVQELGREPYSTRRFFIRYQDRILFGTDGGFGMEAGGEGWTTERMYRSYFEFLETDNEYIKYPMSDISKQGMWRVYGIHLPAEVLEKIYFRNAERLIPPSAEVLTRLRQVETAN